MTRSGAAILAGFFFVSIVRGQQAPSDTIASDTATMSHIQEPILHGISDTNAFRVFTVGDTYVAALLDSLVRVKFLEKGGFGPGSGIADNTPCSGEAVTFPDSVYEARIEALNRLTPIEMAFNRQIRDFIHLYAVKKRELSSRILGLSELYFPLFEEMLDRYDLPLELKYLAVVESALNPTANSRAGAKGLWQFMYGTGKLYGLRVNSLVDERFDIYKSTDAACRHLRDLHDIYGNWSLALAAYNSGAGNVNKAIRRAGGSKSYWAIWPYLPRETRGYVPAFIAVTYVLHHAADHGICPVSAGFTYADLDTVMVRDALSFDQISEMLHVPMEDLQFLNPAYKAGIIPAKADHKYPLVIHRDFSGIFITCEDSLYRFKTSRGIERENLLAEIKKASERNIHVVRSGENLGVIAGKYGCSVRNLMSWNDMRSTLIRPGQKLVVYSPGYTGKPSKQSVSDTQTTTSAVSSDGWHLVSSGESLGHIASRYGCSIESLRKWNNLTSSIIYPNQKLRVSAPAEKRTEPVAEIPNRNNNRDQEYVYHVVKKGDTLWDIARLYQGATVDQIKRLNNIRNTRGLKPGQKLKIHIRG
ncbi:MAG: LysM peptidoglycan-binding domain-containing protein [Bacteroidales bacterium]|nr:LysM peptidoglycan-binding domain-containing protein [Bacteroidales bacterium]